MKGVSPDSKELKILPMRDEMTKFESDRFIRHVVIDEAMKQSRKRCFDRDKHTKRLQQTTYRISLLEQEFRQVWTILTGNTSNKSNFTFVRCRHDCFYWKDLSQLNFCVLLCCCNCAARFLRRGDKKSVAQCRNCESQAWRSFMHLYISVQIGYQRYGVAAQQLFFPAFITRD